MVGDKGQIFSPDDYGTSFYLKLKDEKEFSNGASHAAVRGIPQTIPRNQFIQVGGSSDCAPPGMDRRLQRRRAGRIRTSTLPLTSPKSCCWAASPCAPARNSNGTGRTCVAKNAPKPRSSSTPHSARDGSFDTTTNNSNQQRITLCLDSPDANSSAPPRLARPPLWHGPSTMLGAARKKLPIGVQLYSVRNDFHQGRSRRPGRDQEDRL